MDSLSRQVVRAILKRRDRGIPEAIRDKTALHIMDAVGIALAAHVGDPAATLAIAGLYSGVEGGKCQVIGGDRRLPPAQAAFANTTLAHTMDYDDIDDISGVHPTSSILPSALAAADICQASGRQLLEAVALADEFFCRFGLAVEASAEKGERRPMTRWFLTQLLGYMSHAVAAGLVLGFSEDELVSAFGLGYMQTAGCKEPAFAGGSNTRAMYPSFGAMGGVHAALLARAGVIGPSTALEGVTGLYRNYLGMEPERARLDILLDTEGWAFDDVKVKPYPACRLTNSFISATLAVRERLAPSPSAGAPATALPPIERIVVRVDPPVGGQLCRPIEMRRRPPTLQDAKYSIPFMVAFTLSRGRVDLQTLNTSALADAQVLALVDRVEVVEDVPPHPSVEGPAYVNVFFPGGSVESGPCYPPRFGREEIIGKFMDCATFAGLGSAASELRDRLLHLDEIQVADLFAGIPPVGHAPRG